MSLLQHKFTFLNMVVQYSREGFSNTLHNRTKFSRFFLFGGPVVCICLFGGEWNFFGFLNTEMPHWQLSPSLNKTQVFLLSQGFHLLDPHLTAEIMMTVSLQMHGLSLWNRLLYLYLITLVLMVIQLCIYGFWLDWYLFFNSLQAESCISELLLCMKVSNKISLRTEWKQ